MKKNNKSPLTDKPLRNPGQSLDEEIDKVINDEAMMYLITPLFLIVLTAFEWYRWYSDAPPSPWTLTFMALIAVIYSAYKMVPLLKRLKSLKQGRDGERAVAELLNFYREAKMRVFHDIVGDDFNIDHVVVSTRGIFLIETKTYSKPLKGKTEIVFDGKTIIQNGRPLKDAILIQAKAGKIWLARLIEELTARKFDVQPVVVFPGWFVKMTHTYKNDIWVLNPMNLDKFITNRNESLTEEDVKLISNHLGRYIRSTQH